MNKHFWIFGLGFFMFELGLLSVCNKPAIDIDWTPTQNFIQWNGAFSLFIGIFTMAYELKDITD